MRSHSETYTCISLGWAVLSSFNSEGAIYRAIGIFWSVSVEETLWKSVGQAGFTAASPCLASPPCEMNWKCNSTGSCPDAQYHILLYQLPKGPQHSLSHSCARFSHFLSRYAMYVGIPVDQNSRKVLTWQDHIGFHSIRGPVSGILNEELDSWKFMRLVQYTRTKFYSLECALWKFLVQLVISETRGGLGNWA